MASDTSTRRRVKLYMLNENRVWDDQGTGHVASVPIDKVSKGLSLVVRSEVDGKVLLESKIQMNTAYQKQQETLIVWSEVDNYDYALSFQDKAGCDEIWEKICEVQGKDPSVEITQDIVESEDMEDDRFDEIHDTATSALEMPACELSRLDEIAELFSSSLLTPIKREKLSISIENESYIKRLIELFHVCEDLENTEGLHRLYSIFKAMFLLNKTALFELLFTDELIMDVIGILEYDPQANQVVKHREYIEQQARLKEVIPLSNTELVKKIHQTYRVQYIQDIILPMPSMFEENLLSTLNSFVYFNKMEIVTMIQEDEKFLKSLFKQLTDDEIDDSARRDLILFLKEFCTFSQTLTQQNRESFFKVLSSLGILNTLEAILSLDDCTVKSLAVDIFSFIVEFNPSIVREFVLLEAQSQEDEDLLINMILEQLTTDADPELGGAMQLMGTIRLLIDPENMVTTMQKTEKAEFLQFFYPHCMHVLTAPLFANTVEEKPSKDDYQTAQLLSLILELLTFCVEHHTYHVKTYIMSKNLLRRVLVLLKSRHSFLNLAALRLLRRMIGLKDEFYNRYIIKHDLFKPVVEAFVANGSRYNLLNSAIIELFEFIRTEDIKSLVSYVVEKHFSAFENVTYVQTFKVIKQRHEQQQDRLMNKPENLDGLSPMLRNSRFHRESRMLEEEEEEMWFEQDEDIDDTDLGPKLDTIRGKLDLDYKPNKLLTINKSNEDSPGGGGATFTPRRSLPVGGLTKSISINISSSTSSVVSSAASASSLQGSLGANSPSLTPASSPDVTSSTAEHMLDISTIMSSHDDDKPGSTDSPSSESADKVKSSVEEAAGVSSTSAKSGAGLIGLVDYPDEDSDEEQDNEDSGEVEGEGEEDKDSVSEKAPQQNSDDSDDSSDVLVPASKRPRLST